MKKNIVMMVGFGSLWILSTACSSNKPSDKVQVESSGDGKGTAPPAASAKQDDLALVRFVNGTTGAKDLAFGDATAFDDVGKFDITAYKPLKANRGDFKLFVKDDKTNPLATNNKGLDSGKHYTVLAFAATQGTLNLDPVVDNLAPPAPGMVKIRVINLAPTMKSVDLYAGGKEDALISGAGLDQPTDYKEIAPSNASLYVRNTMSKQNSVAVKDISLEAGKLYTIIIFEDQKGKPKIKTVKDEFTTPPDGANS